MINGINPGISQIQLLNATNAFKAAAVKPESLQANNTPQVSDGVQVNDKQNILKNVDVDEIKQYASIAGEENLSEEDITYGLVYGRSVMADWVV